MDPMTPRARRLRRFVAVPAVLALGLLAACGEDPAAPAPGTATSASEGATAGATSPAAARAPQERTTGNVTVTATSVIVGDPDAPERVVVYEDLNCPYCRALHEAMDTDADVVAWAGGGDVAVEHVVVDYLGPRTTHKFSTRGAALLAVVADADPEAWPAVLTALYEARPEAGTDAGPSDDELLALAREAGADLDDADAAAVREQAFGGWVEEVTAYAAAEGVSYIPQVYVDDELVEGETEADVLTAVKARVTD